MEKVKKEKKSTEAKAPEINIDMPSAKEIDSLQYYFGKRKLDAFDNSEVLKTRLLYHMESAKNDNCFDIVNKNTNERVGKVSQIQLAYAWRIAHSNDAKKACQSISLAMTESEWNEDREKLEKYLRDKNIVSSSAPVLFNHVLSIPEAEYESIGLKKPKQVTVLLQMGILGEIAENERLIATWKKIKRYPHKIALEESNGGVFSYEDASKLRRIGIRYLNDIRKHNVYQMKNLLMTHDFERLVQQINTAYKNDLERRKDFRYKVHPFVAGFINISLVLIIAYIFKYTLIKNSDMTLAIIAGFALIAVDAVTVFFGARRAVRRRRVRYDYVYFSEKIRKCVKIFSTIFIFTTISVLVFYLRYDGYDDILYYRNIGDNNITIANLRDESVEKLYIPKAIDGKTVTEIDSKCFKGTDLINVYIPDTVEVIEKKAFKKCKDLTEMSLPDSIKELGKEVFAGCKLLTEIDIPEVLDSVPANSFRNSGLVTVNFPDNKYVAVESGAFKGCELLETVNNMDKITVIGASAFENCDSLGSLNFSSKLTEIGNRAFAGCELIKKIEIPASVKTIGKRAFNGCESVWLIYVPETVEFIGQEAFRNCNSLTTLTIPYTGTSAEKSEKQNISSIISVKPDDETKITVTYSGMAPIGSKAFNDADWITKLIIDDGVTSIAGGAMRNMTGLEYIKLPTTLTEIPDSLFEGCDMLSSVAGMENIKIIGNEAFRKCYALEYIDLENIEQIGDGCFEECTFLTSVGMLTKLQTIGEKAFYNCYGLNISGGLGNVKSVGESAFQNCDSIKELGFSSKMQYIGDKAFHDCDGITEVNLANAKMEYLGDKAFYNCENIVDVDLTYAQIQTIGDDVFNSCHSIVEARLSNMSVGEMGVNMFANCSYLETALLSSKMAEIPDGMFNECYNLSQVNFSSINPKTIGKDAFYDCDLYSVILNKGLESIGENAFRGNDMISIDIPDSVTFMGENCFAECSVLTSVEAPFIGKTVKKDGGYKWMFGKNAAIEYITVTKAEKIYSNTFNHGQDSLLSVTLNEGITVIESSAFEDCKYLYKVNIPSTVEKIGSSAFQDCVCITSVTIPDGVTKIEEKTFKGCSELMFVNFGTMQVKSIGNQAFRDTNVGSRSIVFSDSLEKIGRNAFEGCDVYSVTYSKSMEDISLNAFGSNPDMTVYVPRSLYETYVEKYKDEKDVNVSLATYN